MNMVISDIAGKPSHDRACLHKAGGFQGCFFVSPARIVPKGDASEVMLCIKEVSSNRAGDEMRNDLGQQKRLPAKEPSERCPNREVHDQRNQAIRVLPPVVEKRIQAHPVKKDKNVAEEDGERMTHEQVGEALALSGVEKLRLGHDRKGSDMRTSELGVVIVMVVV